MSDDEPDPIQQLAFLAEALAEEDDDDTDKIDMAAWAEDIRKRVAAKAAEDKAAFHADLGARAKRNAARLAARAPEPIRRREEQLAILAAITARLPPGAASVHFMKLEEATDEDLARIVGELRALEEESEEGDGEKGT